MIKFDTDMQVEEAYGTFKGEPASEDGWNDEELTPEEELQPWQRNLRAEWLAKGY